MFHHKSNICHYKIRKKRKSSINAWRKVSEFRRCQPKGPPLPPVCNHNSSKFKCTLLDAKEMESFHRKFYYTWNRARQDAFIRQYCQGRNISAQKRKISVEYFVPVKEQNLQVCKNAFIGILRVTKYRINSLLKFYSKDSIESVQGKEFTRQTGRKSYEWRKVGKAKNGKATNSKSMTNNEESTSKDFSVDYRCCQSACVVDNYSNFTSLSFEIHDASNDQSKRSRSFGKLSKPEIINELLIPKPQKNTKKSILTSLQEGVVNENDVCNSFEKKHQTSNITDCSSEGLHKNKTSEKIENKKLRFRTPVSYRVESSPEEESLCLDNFFNFQNENKSNEAGTNIMADKVTSCSISMIEKVDQEKKLIDQRKVNCDSRDDVFDWLNLSSKPRSQRTFDWSPLRHTYSLITNSTVGNKVIDSPQKKKKSSILQPRSNIKQNTCESTVIETTMESFELTPNPRSSLYDQSHVYESRKRRLKKLQSIDEKENVFQESINKKQNINDLKAGQKSKPIIIINQSERSSLLKRRADKSEQKTRLPLQTLQYFKNQRLIYGKY